MTTRIINASAHDFPMLADGSVHAIVTSPPYWGLRKYAGEQDVEWPGVSYAPIAGMPPITVPAMRCGLGMEPTIEAYIGHIILCVREWWRVLRDDGTLWLNVGDSYYGGKGQSSQAWSTEHQDRDTLQKSHHQITGKGETRPTDLPQTGLKPKDLCMIPARLALAMQADGWYLRHVVPWVKRNCLPGSQQDRPTTAHEYVYLFAKSERYFYDQDAVRLPYAPGSAERELRGVGGGHKNVEGAPGQTPHSLAQPRPNKSRTFARRNGSKEADVVPGQGYATHRDGREDDIDRHGGRMRRDSDWFFDSLRFIVDGGQGLVQNEDGEPLSLVVNTRSYSGAHFACFPPGLVDPMVLASTSDFGCCAACGSPWVRVVDKEFIRQPDVKDLSKLKKAGNKGMDESSSWGEYPQGVTVCSTLGWRPTCACPGLDGDAPWPDCAMHPAGYANWPVVPAVVFDPFHGSGTSGSVAVANRRDYIGVDISADYLAGHDRISGVQIKML